MFKRDYSITSRTMLHSLAVLNLFHWIISLGLIGCADNSNSAHLFESVSRPPSGDVFPYQLTSPEQTFYLPPVLTEISGLTFGDDEKYFAAIQDEKGTIFLLDTASGKIVREVVFGEPGDYEDITRVGKSLFVLKNTGTLFEVTHLDSTVQHVTKHTTFLDKNADAEGLCFDAKRNQLLIACKGNPAGDTAYHKSVFRFDLEEKVLDSLPLIDIDLDDLAAYLNQSPRVSFYDQLLGGYAADKKSFSFSPSAIAIHPHSGHTYLLSSVGKLLMVLDTSGKILHLEKLKKEHHPQPEGLCFQKDGTLWITNEGKKNEPGTISRYPMKQ